MDEGIKLLDVKEKTIENTLPTRQSANSLFRFVTKGEYLYNILRKKALIPRFYEENIEYLGVDHKTVWYPMICFCDINIHRLEPHTDFYGSYGIAFSKRWGLERGVQPIQYLNSKSVLCNDLKDGFMYSMEAEDNKASDYILTHMLFCKPVQGIMPRDGEEKKKNFTDECEWRFVPRLSDIGLPTVVTEENTPSVATLNKTLERTEECWLHFSYDEIKYIILPADSDIDELEDVLDEIGIEKKLKVRLFSKVIILNDAKEDF